ncbi:MAG: hypothetical protein P0Y60_09435 [Candidatus Microbacterium colombiense]|nr:MAG: hypothetical protein P0Y60_09435 [Microbacterium sp.]
MISRMMPAAAGALLLLVVLTSCAQPSAPAASPRPSAEPSSPAASPEPVLTDAPETPAAEISCESMISEGTVTALTEAGWSAKPKDFVIGDVDLTAGLLCFWADYSVGSDHGQLYGWSEISADEAASAQAALLASGWTREDGPEGTYLTEDPQFSMGTDDDGYGMTYLFHDGWVKLADTRQGLVLIEWTG